MKTDIGQGKQALMLAGGGTPGYVSTGNQVYGTSSPWTVTPATSPVWTVSTSSNLGTANVWTGYVVVAATGVYGVVVSNTATALTVDRWVNPASPTGAAGTTPVANTAFVIVPGNASAFVMALTNTVSFTPVHGDTTLSGEQSTNGLGRLYGTFAHTFSASSTNNTYTLTGTWTYSGSTAVTLTGIGVFDAFAASSGTMLFETALNSPATVNASGDALTVSQTVTM